MIPTINNAHILKQMNHYSLQQLDFYGFRGKMAAVISGWVSKNIAIKPVVHSRVKKKIKSIKFTISPTAINQIIEKSFRTLFDLKADWIK